MLDDILAADICADIIAWITISFYLVAASNILVVFYPVSSHFFCPTAVTHDYWLITEMIIDFYS